MAFQIVVIGTSKGGLKALQALFSRLPKDFPLPLAVVQHRLANSKSELPKLLQQSSTLPVIEPEDKEPILPGRVYIAPADYHLLVEKGQKATESRPRALVHFSLSTEAPVLHARPSIDLLFSSAADAYGPGVIAVVLTGASTDGLEGAKRIKERGGHLIAQDLSEAESSVMPQAVLKAVPETRALPVKEIGEFLASIGCSGSKA